MTDEGYIKFNCSWQEKKINIPSQDYKSLINCRKILVENKLIGVYPNGIGFGNISVRYKNTNQFIITGSVTGHLNELKQEHFVKVTNFNILKNELSCIGKVKASSESLSHAVIYQLSHNINAVIHVHHQYLWEKLMNKVPTTDKNISYGTPEMAIEIIRLFKESDLPNKQILVMGGHKDGVIAFGENLETVSNKILDYL